MKSNNSSDNIKSEIAQYDLGRIESWYKRLQSPFSVCQLDTALGSRLVHSQSNAAQPIHSWYVLKEAYSYELPSWAIQRIEDKYKIQIGRVLDPFVGCGTTGIALSSLNIAVDGLEYNPFIRFVAATKASSSIINEPQVVRFIKALRPDAPTGSKFYWPKLSTLHEPMYFRRSDIRYLLFILKQIEEKVSCDNAKKLLRLGVARSLEPLSNLRKDGRALRYIKKYNRPTASDLLPIIWQGMLKDISSSKVTHDGFTIYSGNAKDLASASPISGGNSSIAPNSYDLVLYSPPYLNNFDYSEIYKLELWVLGFVTSYAEWKELRNSTVRSHHSIKFSTTNELSTDKRTRNIQRWINSLADSECLTGYAASNMPEVIKGYFDDMYLVLKEQFRVLKPGGFLVFVVANSRHAHLPIATDIILGEIARKIGFEPLELVVLKKRNGRTREKNFLRESLVFMRKPF